MKIRMGFITNSSSTNFLIISKKELTEDYLFKKLEFIKGGALEEQGHDLCASIMSSINSGLKYHDERLDYERIEKIFGKKSASLFNKNKKYHTYCGAVAVSWYSRLKKGLESNIETIMAIERLIDAGCTTNIHYVVSKDTIDEAIVRLEQNLFPSKINAIVFILYKPVGDGTREKVLMSADSRFSKFFSLLTDKKYPYRIGFDTCFTPAILHWTNAISTASIDACEAATFSMYIDSEMNCYPCSFGLWNKSISESMHSKSLREIWLGKKFSTFREKKKEKCVSCTHRLLCQDGCRLGIDIDLC